MKTLLLPLFLCFALPSFAQVKSDTTKQQAPVAFDKAPEFPGGQAAMGAFLSAKLQGPMNAIKNRIGGQVVIYFDIAPTGALSNFRIQKSLRKDIDKMILDGLKTMPKWKPGTNKGTPVPVTYSLPIMVPPATATPLPASKPATKPAIQPKKN